LYIAQNSLPCLTHPNPPSLSLLLCVSGLIGLEMQGRSVTVLISHVGIESR
jgi:hypothetical protein